MKTLDALLFELSQKDIHLWLEGDRLRYRAAKDAITPELLTEIKNRKAEIVKFLRQATGTNNSQLPPIVKIDRSGALPLSFGQQRLWYLHQFEPESSSNNVPVVVRFNGVLNIPILEKSLQAVARRHEVLRTRFPSVDDQPTQVIEPDVDLTLPVLDLRNLQPEQGDAEALRLATEEARCPFNLAKGPILRVLLIQLSDDEYLLVWNMHCIICDGASSDVFYQDLTTIYTAFIDGKPSPLKELSIQYVDFAHWQRQWLKGEVLESQINYWKQKLEGSLSVIPLPTDHTRPPIVQTYRGDRRARMLPKSLNESLSNLSQKLGGTLFMTLIAAFETLLHRYSQKNDILISFACAGRGEVETEGVVGFFSNTLMQRINFDGNPTFRELFDRVREASLEANTYQDLPFEKLVEELPPELSNSRSPLFQVKFALNPPWSNGRGMASVKLPDLTITSLFGYIYHGKTKYDLILVMREQDEGLGMVFDYNADLFESSTIARMLVHLENILEGIAANPDQRISDLPLLSIPEREKILYKWNENQIPIPDACMHQLFESQVEQSPDAIAIIGEDAQLTYQELNNRANQMAHYLQAKGVGTETLVAICIEKSTQLLVSLLGILKSGGTYIPLDPSYPHERRIDKLKNAQVALILTHSSMADSFSECSAKVVSLDLELDAITQHRYDAPLTFLTAENLAYVIYTSGSTGQPKGVMISHRSMVNHSMAICKIFELSRQDRVLHFSNISFDAAVEEIFPTWLSGGTLVLPTKKLYTSITYFLEEIAQQSITIINLPTAFWHEMVHGISILNKPLPTELRLVIVGGEKVSKSTYQKWRSLVGDFPRWLNTYGPTETTVSATVYEPSGSLHPDAEVPIGRAIANLQTYILDHNLQPSPIGATGELYIGGVGLSRGYLNRPDITAKRFIANPFSKNSKDRLYKTGDVARYLPDGNIEFIGRSDFQIKIRGFRVEPIEIETRLEQYPAIKQAIVLCHEAPNGEKFLVAYLSAEKEQAIDIESLGKFLRQKLPSYMLPSRFIVLDTLPLTPNGKVDRRALLELDAAQEQNDEAITPRDELEQQLANIWQKLFGVNDISVTANFFELGGNSLLTVRLVTEIERVFNYHFPLSSFFETGTIAGIAKWMREKPSETISLDEIPSGLDLEDYRAFLALCAGRIGKHIGKRGLIVEVPPAEMKSSKPFIWIGYIDFSKNLGLHQPVYTIPGGSWTPLRSTENYIEAIASVIVDELLSIPQDEPYLIGGNCYEGIVAMEVAHQLQKKGKEVAFLAVVDKPGPSQIYDKLRQVDLKFCQLKFHLLQLLPLSLINKAKYILEKLFSPKAKQEIRKIESERDFNQFADEEFPSKSKKPLNEYDRILPQAWDSIEEVLKSHCSKGYSGRVILTTPTRSGLRSGMTEINWTDFSWLFPYYGWGNSLTGRVELYKIDCAHADVGMKKNAEQIGRLIWQASEEFR
ncbi:amino acid adenylation domain-containing protein [Pseudanabaena sp. UWO311]|uniref:non-ribosomal peptide synthetase n=1 Tax=Pseudanabaena sp. UWO311 TaxID=2487337 RepID=UPI0011572131|nr:non-ribosomal peptide synthetase [Pseudanabaena sp. UWO311]TYQ24768.1 amino acid adenylation domain-containing protein [Pseudanabaena sp. UWO311]